MRKPVIERLFFAFAAAAAAAGCVKDAPETESGPLPEPEVVVSGITCTSFKVSWKDVTDAGSYTYIFNGGEEIETRDNNLVFEELSPNQSYTFAVRTNAGSNGNHTASKFVNLRVTTEDYSVLSAPEPTLVAAYMSKTIIQWNSVYGATEYEYTVGPFSGKTETCSVEIGGLEGSKEYVFEVKALSDDEFVNESPAAQLKFTTRPESEDIPQIIMAHVETGSDYCQFNVYAVADTRYLYFGVPVSYFGKYTDTQIRDNYLAAFLAALESAGIGVSSGIQQYAYNGTASFVETPLYPEMSYYIVAFGVNTAGQATTPLYKFETKTLAEDTAPIPDVKGEPWFSQMLYHSINGVYNASNSMWVRWIGQDVAEVIYLMTSTRSYSLYFDSTPELFRKYVKLRGTNLENAKAIEKINSENGFSTRFLLNANTSYTLGAMAINSENDTTFVVNSLPTKASANYYDWALVTLGTTESDALALAGVFQFAYDPEEGGMNLGIRAVRYCFCKLSELSGISTDRAAEIVASRGTDMPQANIDMMNITGKFSLSFGTEGAALEPETQYILLATFTERSGDTATRFATATTGAASEEVPTRAAFGAPKARIEFNAPVLIDTYSPVVGDEF